MYYSPLKSKACVYVVIVVTRPLLVFFVGLAADHTDLKKEKNDKLAWFNRF